jgi:hypothetical protein
LETARDTLAVVVSSCAAAAVAARLRHTTEGAHVLQGVHGVFSGEIPNCDMKLLIHVSLTVGLSLIL